MTHNDKIAALMAAINDNITLGEQEKKVVASALVEGFIRILEVEDAEQRAQQPHTYFPAEFLPGDGFCFWNSGGFRGTTGKGEALISVGLNGEHTRVLRTKSELNGRHQLTAVYPGCYIGHCQTADPLSSPAVTIYQITGFVRRDDRFLAKCRRVLQTVSDLEADKQERFGLLLSVCREVAMEQNARSISWKRG